MTYTIGVFALIVLSYTLFFLYGSTQENVNEEVSSQQEVSLRPYSFQQKQSLQDALKSPFFSLAPVDRPLRLPDLRSYFAFLGCNERPDLALEKMRVQFTLRGGSPQCANAGEKVFLRFDGHTNRWNVSDKPTCLSVVFKPRDNGVDVKAEILDENGVVTLTPTEHQQFFLQATGNSSTNVGNQKKWDVDGMTAEALLLEKQGARWYGKDVMIEVLGGSEYSYESERERVQFGTEDDSYVLWVKEGDCFVFLDGRWSLAKLGGETKKKILLQAKKIDEKEILFDLWNPDGSLHVVCSIKRRDDRRGTGTMPEIKLIGARSQKHWIAEIDGKRMMISPTDWIIFTKEGPSKIDTEKLLDEYIEGSLSGSLLALSGMEKINGEASLTGLFFDRERASKEDLTIPLYRSYSSSEDTSKKERDVDADDEDEDDDEDDMFLDDDDDDDES